MASEREPSLDEWRRLYDAAADFREVAPWTWLTDSHVFAVVKPGSRETAYCSIMGNGGAQFGLTAFRGARGFSGLAVMESKACDPEELLLVQDCLSLYFADREDMEEDDTDVHASLGLQFGAKGEWPIFRSLVPSYVGRTLDAYEAAFLASCLEQSCAFVKEVLSGMPLPQLPSDEWLLSRQAGADGVWRTIAAPLPDPLPAPQLEVIPVRAASVASAVQRSDQTWEVKQVALGPVTGDGSEPAFFGRALLCVDHASGLIFPGDVLGPDDSLQEALLVVAEEAGMLPAVLMATSEVLEQQLRPLAELLGIEIRQVAHLAEAEKAAEALKTALQGP